MALVGVDVGPRLPLADPGAGREFVLLVEFVDIPDDRTVVGRCPVTNGGELELS